MKELVLNSLLGEEIVLESEKEIVDNISKKIEKSTKKPVSVKKQLSSKKVSIEDKLNIISQEVNRVLGHFKTNVGVIYTKQELHNYIDKAISNGFIAIDTETNNSLDYLTCKLMGLCLYTPGENQVYIPINHKDLNNNKLTNQVSEQDIKEELDRLKENNVKNIFHNGKFDCQVIKCTCNCTLDIWWDTMIASKLIDENDQSAGLKWQYVNKIDSSQEKYDIEHLFTDIEYAYVSPELFALYAATDSYITYKLYEYQKEIMDSDDFKDIKKLFFDVEMPMITILADMEIIGIKIDKNYAKKLSDKYHSVLDILNKNVEEELHKYDNDVKKWRLTKSANEKTKTLSGNEGKSKSEKLEDPINLDSSTQLAILLYDIIKVPVIDKKNPRGTGKGIIDVLDNPLCKAITERKKILKLSKDFVDELPNKVNIDGRIHCSFGQLTAATGRMACSSPNLQQVPSQATDIRMMFEAEEGKCLIGADFSAQEPRICAFMSRDNGMLTAYKEGKDLYSYIASMSFNKPYEDCMEFYLEGTEIIIDGKKVICGKKEYINEDGKLRRSQSKKILLGLLYGRGTASIAEQLSISKEEAEELVNKFFNAFPSVKEWIEKTHKKVHEVGYVTDWYGRRRRLKNVQLPRYEIVPKTTSFNPLLECSGINRKIESNILKYKNELNSCRYNSQIEEIIKDASLHGLEVKKNSSLIAEAERQSVNAIIQGGAATLTKLAMINIKNDKILNDCQFKMLIPIHDEILGECPIEYKDIVAKRLSEVMIDTAKPYMDVPMSVDSYVVSHWYEDSHAGTVLDFYNKLIKPEKKNVLPLSKEEAYKKTVEKYTELDEDAIKNIIFNGASNCGFCDYL